MRIAPTAAISMIAVLGACFSDRRDPTNPADLECSVVLPEPGADEVVLTIRDFAFHPVEIRVERGTTVIWVNCEPATVPPHTVTAEDGAWGSASLPPAGGAFARTFDSAGRFDYHCVPHPFMRATVIVED